MLHKLYRLWVILLILSGGVAVWFSGVAIGSLLIFFQYSQTQSAHITSFAVTPQPFSRFAITAAYHYTVGGVEYTQEDVLSSCQFLSHFAAEHYIPFLYQKKWVAFYKKGHPQASCLENPFPSKDCVHALITIAVFVYFYFAKNLLSRYLQKIPK